MTTPTGAATPGPIDLDGWIASNRGVWVETCGGVGGPDPEPPEGEQIGEFNTPEQAQLAAAAPVMRDALQADLDWWGFENAGCPYPEGMCRDAPEGEAIWKEWYGKCLAMCDHARELQRAALAAASIATRACKPSSWPQRDAALAADRDALKARVATLDVRFEDEGKEYDLIDWQAKLQTDLGIERVNHERTAAARDALMVSLTAVDESYARTVVRDDRRAATLTDERDALQRRVAALRDALEAEDSLLSYAQTLCTRAILPASDSDTISGKRFVNLMIRLLDGPRQREVQTATRVALATDKKEGGDDDAERTEGGD